MYFENVRCTTYKYYCFNDDLITYVIVTIIAHQIKHTKKKKDSSHGNVPIFRHTILVNCCACIHLRKRFLFLFLFVRLG